MRTLNDHNQQFGSLKVLRVYSSARSEGSMSRWVADELIEQSTKYRSWRLTD